MVTTEIIKNAAQDGLPALIDLFKNLSKEDALKGLGILAILGLGYKIIDTIREIVLAN